MRLPHPVSMITQLLRSLVAPRLQLQPVRVMLILGALLLVPVAVQAQQARQVTFNEAVRLALEQNLTLQRTANSVDLQQIQVASNRATYYPNLNFSSSGRQSYGRTFSQEDLNFVNETTESASFSVGSSVLLFDGFGRRASLEEAKLGLEARDLDFQRQRQAVVFNVMSTYLLLIERQEQVRIQEENLEAQQQLLAQIEEFTQVGSRPISDLFQQQAQVASTELALLNAQRLVQISEAGLIQTIQLDPFGQYEFVAPTVEDAQLVAETYDIQGMLQQAFTQRADLRARDYDIQAAQSAIQVAQSGIWPSLSLNGGYGTGWNSQFRDPEDPSQAAAFFDQLDQQRGGSLSLSLSVPIFDRFNTRNNTQRAEVQYENARLELDGLQQDIAVQVRQAYLDYQTAVKGLDVTEKQLASAELSLEAEQERYNVGASTLVELSQAQANYIQAAADRVSARYNFLFQEKLIEYYLGVLDPSQPLFR